LSVELKINEEEANKDLIAYVGELIEQGITELNT
jgi:hypothetical protein